MAVSENNMQAFGEYLYNLRTEKNIKLSKVATALNIHASTISNWEKGTRLSDILSLKQLSTLYNVPLNDFLNVLSPSKDIESPASPLPDFPPVITTGSSGNENLTDNERQKPFSPLGRMTHEQQQLFILTTLMVATLLVARVFAPLNLVLCLVALFLIWKKALHSGWLYLVIILCAMSDIYTISGWFLH